MRVLIAGGGIAGLALAALLQRTGVHEPLVLERAQAYGEAGYGLGLYPLGGAVFNALGLGEALRERSTVLHTYAVHGPKGQLLQSVDLSDLLAPYGPMLGVSRATVIDLLASKVDPAAIRFGTTVKHAAISADPAGGITLISAGGERFEAPVAIAADGMHSHLRQQLFPTSATYDTGFDAWMWWAPPLAGEAAHTAAEHWGPSSFLGLYPMPGCTNVAFGLPRDLSPDPSLPAAQILAALRQVAEAHAPGEAQLEGVWQLQQGQPFRWPLSDQRAPEITALGGRLALLGDAGIGFLPTAGVGASNALRSAAALAYELELADAITAPAALRRWRQRIQGLVQGNQVDSRQLAKLMLVRHGSSSALVNTLMKVMPVTAMTRSIIASMEAAF